MNASHDPGIRGTIGWHSDGFVVKSPVIQKIVDSKRATSFVARMLADTGLRRSPKTKEKYY